MNAIPEVTIILINFNGLKDTLECVESLFKSTYENFRIFILDNGSKENEADILKKKINDSRVTIKRSEKNLGFAGGNNKVINEVNTKFVILLNNDTIVDLGWLEPLISLAVSDNKIAAIQPKIRSYYQPAYFEYAGAAGGFMDKLGYPFARGRVGFILEKDEGQYNTKSEIFWASGSCMLLNREVAIKEGLLPEEFFFYHEETDLCWRLIDAGYKIMYEPHSIIFHKGSGSSKSNLNKKIYFVHRNNLLLLLRNMSFSRLLWVFPLRIFLDLLSCIYYVFKGQAPYVYSVLRAHYDTYKLLPAMGKKRAVNKIAEKQLAPISIFFDFFIRGKKRYSEIIPSIKKTEIVNYTDILPPNDSYDVNKKLIKSLLNASMIFSVVVVILSISWFRKGQLIAGGEEALLFASPSRILNIFISPWYASGTGYPMPIILPRVPQIAIDAILAKFIPLYLAQAIIYAFHIFAALYGTYLLSLKIGLTKKVSILSSLTYLFNLYSMTQVWGRMLMTGISVWAYLPLFIYLYICLISTNKKKNLIYFIASSLVFSFAYGHPSSLIVLWLPGLAYSLTIFIKDKSWIVIAKTVSIIFLWILINIWWIYPYIKISSTAFESINSTTENLESLRGVSHYFPLQSIIQLRQEYYLSNEFYGGLFTRSHIYVITIVGVVFVLLGIYSLRKKPFFIFLLVSSAITLFITKGSNSFLGNEFFAWLFSTIPPMQALRNPYEKLGVLLSLFYSIFFANGINYTISYIKSKPVKIITSGIVFFVFCIYLVWPIWSGTVFGQGKYTIKLTVPKDYEEINQAIISEKSDGRILMVPMIPGDGVRYLWSTGIYSGIEPSEYLFDNQTIGRKLRSQIFDKKYQELFDSFEKNNFDTLLNELNIRYIVLQKKIDHKSADTLSASEAASILERNQQIDKIRETENLVLFVSKSIPINNRIIAKNLQPKKLSYSKISTTKYLVKIDDAQNPFDLIFKESFNKSWKATINGLEIKEHKIAYDYANMWYVESKGTYDITIEFKY